MRPICKPHRHRSDRGSVILLVLLFTALVALLGASLHFSSVLQREQGRDNTAALRSDLAAQSALEYSRRRLSLDPEWPGTTDGAFGLPHGERFDVVVIPEPGSRQLEVVGTARRGGSAHLTARLSTVHLAGIDDKALVTAGGNVELLSGQVNGDVLIGDDATRIWDWSNTEGGYVEGGPEAYSTMNLGKVPFNGTLYKFTDRDYLAETVGSGEQLLDPDLSLALPSWDLDPYLQPREGRTILTGGGTYTGLRENGQVVFVLQPGETLVLDDCAFGDGLIVHCERDTDLRAEPRNEVQLRSCRFGTAANPHIGILAPACRVTMARSLTGPTSAPGDGSSAHGFTYLHSLVDLDYGYFQGQTFVVNDLLDVTSTQFLFHSQVGSNPPEGVATHGGRLWSEIDSVHEDYHETSP